jgi:hypothetical protein
LIISTVLAGIFCTLYLTKPVHLVAPMEQEENVLPLSRPVLEQEQPYEEVPSEHGNLVAAPVDRLNPLQESLPGEQFSPVNLDGTPSDPVAKQTGLQPLVVNGPRKSLFVPIQPKDAALDEKVEETGVVAMEALSSEDAVIDAVGGLTVDIPIAGEASELVGLFSHNSHVENGRGLMNEKASTVQGGEHFAELAGTEPSVVSAPRSSVATASIIGEFYTLESSGVDSPQEEPQNQFHQLQ